MHATAIRYYHTTSLFLSKNVILYDSLSDSFKSLPSIPTTSEETGDGKARRTIWYTCGPTTYAPAHLGHARTYVCLDILRRILETNPAVSNAEKLLFVMNITDVDDKILAAAKESNEHPTTLARRYEDDFWKDFDRLGCKRPHVVTRVTEYVDTDIVPYIETLVDKGTAYVSHDGVYFDVRAFEEQMGTLTKYGKLAPPAASTDFFNGNRSNDATATSTTKRDARDFVLWKFQKDGEVLSWPSPWGDGRPGWHIECSAMIEAVQRSFDAQVGYHAGGVDLKFPHHTNEIAQAEAYLSTPNWIPHWIHTGHLHIDGLKMSKSLKNFVTIEELFDEQELEASSSLSSPADDFRLWCLGLSGSYRGTATYSKESIREASIIRAKLVKFLLEGSKWVRRRSNPENGNGGGCRKWNDRDHTFHASIENSSDKARNALYGNRGDGAASFDLDGTAFVKRIVAIAEDGMHYIRDKETEESTPVEPIQIALSYLRELLELVGFSSRTVRVGLVNDVDDASVSQIAGGESRLVDEIVQFRSEVRKEAIAGLQNSSNDSLKSILDLCDEVRDKTFPSIGLELTDGKFLDEKDDGDDVSASTTPWRFCLPRESSSLQVSNKADGRSHASPSGLQDVPLQDYFKVGKFADQFSVFDENGFPLQNADGTLVSARLRKKLMKKLDKHKKRMGM